MSRTACYDMNGDEIYEDVPTRAQEQLADIAAKMDDAIKEQEEYYGVEIDNLPTRAQAHDLNRGLAALILLFCVCLLFMHIHCSIIEPWINISGRLPPSPSSTIISSFARGIGARFSTSRTSKIISKNSRSRPARNSISKSLQWSAITTTSTSF